MALLSVVGMSVAGISTLPGVMASTGASTQATTINSCTTIDSPGYYRLGSNVSQADGTCIEITASDVVFDGNGYDVNNSDPPEHDGFGRLAGTGVEVDNPDGLTNVTVKNVHGYGWGHLLTVHNLTDGEVSGVKTPHMEGDDGNLRDTSGIAVTNSRNVDIHNNTLQDPTIGKLLFLRNTTGVQVHNNTFAHANFLSTYGHAEGLVVNDSTDVTVVRNEFTDVGLFGDGITFEGSSDITFAENTITQTSGGIDGTNVVVTDNEFVRSGSGFHGTDVFVASNTFTDSTVGGSGENTTFTRNRFDDETHLQLDGPAIGTSSSLSVVRNTFVEGSGVTVSDSNVRISSNTISDGFDNRGIRVFRGENVSISGNTVTDAGIGISLKETNATVTENVLVKNDEGIRVKYIGRSIDVLQNDIRNNRIGIQITNSSGVYCVEPNNLEVHQNDFVTNTDYAIKNEDPRVVNATNNDWNGEPASPQTVDDPLTDPVTGEPADGTGGIVSEGATSGVSNVHFDPWTETQNNSTA